MTDKARNMGPVDVLNFLEKEDCLSNSSNLAAKNILKGKAEKIPVFLQIFSGLGAFLTAIPFLLFLGFSEIINFSDEFNIFIWGIIFVIVALPIGRATRKPEKIKDVYFHHLALIFMGTGKVLTIIGGSEILPFDEEWNAVLLLIALSGMTYHIFSSSVDRFLSPLSALISIQIAIAYDFRTDLETAELLLNGFFVIQIALAGLLSSGKFRKSLYVPLYFAVLFSLGNIVLSLSASKTITDAWYGFNFAYNVYLIAAILAAVFAYLVFRSSQKLSAIKPLQAGFIFAGILLLALLPTPGILFALILLFIGYRDYNKYLSVIGLGFLVYFIYKYYYDLGFTLLTKSIILMGSGLLLLAGYQVMRVKKWVEGS